MVKLLIQISFVAHFVSMSLWIGGLMFNLLRAEMHFRSGEGLRGLVAIVDTERAERKAFLPTGLFFGVSGIAPGDGRAGAVG